MIRLVLRDLQRSLGAAGFSLVSLAILIFAFLLLVSLSITLTDFGEAQDLPRNLIVVQHGALQPEESRIPPELDRQVEALLGDDLARVDPVIFRIMRVEDHVIQLRGVAPESWGSTFRLDLVDGSWPADDDQILLGQGAIQGTGWRVGGPITIYGHTFIVSGVVEGSGTQAMTAWMSYSAANALFGDRNGIQLLAASLAPAADPVRARDLLQDGLQPAGAFDAYLQDALLRQFGAALNDLRGLALLTGLIGLAAVTLGSHNLAWLAAEERVRLLGILRSLGFERRSVSAFLLIRAGVISAAAYGLALGGVGLFFRFGLAGGELSIGGTQSAMRLDTAAVALGFLLALLSALLGTWLSARLVLAATPTALLGRGQGGSPA